MAVSMHATRLIILNNLYAGDDVPDGPQAMHADAALLQACSLPELSSVFFAWGDGVRDTGRGHAVVDLIRALLLQRELNPRVLGYTQRGNPVSPC